MNSDRSANQERASEKRKITRPKFSALERSRVVETIAKRLFLDHGFEGVSIEMIMSKAGGSNRDFYEAFGSKNALFGRILRRMCSELLEPLHETLQDQTLKELPLAEALTRIAVTVLKILLEPDALAFHRLMVCEAARVPEIAEFFFDSGPLKGAALLGDFLSKCVPTGCVLEAPEIAASVFFDSLLNTLQLKALTGGEVKHNELTSRVKYVVDTFLYGILNA